MHQHKEWVKWTGSQGPVISAYLGSILLSLSHKSPQTPQPLNSHSWGWWWGWGSDLTTIRLAIRSFPFVASVLFKQDERPQSPPYAKMISTCLISVTARRIKYFLCSEECCFVNSGSSFGRVEGGWTRPHDPATSQVWGYIDTVIGTRSKGILGLRVPKMFWEFLSFLCFFPNHLVDLELLEDSFSASAPLTLWALQAYVRVAVPHKTECWTVS